MVFPPHSLAPAELGNLLEAERQGIPFVAYKDETGGLRLEALRDVERITIGRGEHNGLVLGWDPEVSRTHAQLELVGGTWTIVDDGLSRNGSFVNGERIAGRRRLVDGDVLRIGRTSLLFRPRGRCRHDRVRRPHRRGQAQRGAAAGSRRPVPAAGDQRRRRRSGSNRQIAEELHLSLDGVKTHIRALFAKLGIDELPQYRKRTELARRALDLGLVAPRDLRP